MSIKKITFKSLSGDSALDIEFGQTNIIVGPRGGGKSTLFDLLAASQINFVSKDAASFLREDKNIKPDKIVYLNGEIVNFSTLKPLSTKDLKEEFGKNLNIISQKDIAKSGLESTDIVIKEKKKIVKNKMQALFSEARWKNDNFKTIFNFVDAVKRYKNATQAMPNWSTLFTIRSDVKSTSFISSLVFAPHSLKDEIKDTISKLKDFTKTNDDFINAETRYITALENLTNRLARPGDEFLKNARDMLELDKKMFEKRNKVLIHEIARLTKKIYFVESFARSLKIVADEEKEHDQVNKGIESFVAQAQNFFRNSAIALKTTAEAFDDLRATKLKVKLAIREKSSDGMMEYRCDFIAINDEDPEKTFDFIKPFLYAPNVKNDYREWLKKTLENDKFQDDADVKFENEVIRNVIDTTKVLADGKEYDKMSPGEKSIFGIKYKLAHADEEMIFIDQPEDDLDNHSISSEILPLIMKKKQEGKQLFIVTHNANIGILIEPNAVIVANLSAENIDEMYTNRTVEKVCEDPRAYYLEGGYEKLKNRYQILSGSKNEEK